MTEKKNFSSKIDALKEKPSEAVIDRQLIPRLRFMGYLLFFFTFCALTYALLDQWEMIGQRDYLTTEEMEASEGIPFPDFEEPLDVKMFNAYIAASAFTIVGVICLLCAWKKKKKWEEKQEL